MPAPRRPRVVIVDDDPSFRRAACDLFEACGYAVFGEADCGADAHAIVGRCVPDLVVVDVRLGAECGFDVARALTRSHPSLAVLLISADDDVGEPERVAESGARGFLSKSQLATADLGALGPHASADTTIAGLRRWWYCAPRLAY
jgi:DNA-binding NarL/FixJ family response regulator